MPGAVRQPAPPSGADGGSGGGPVETMIVMEALGKALEHTSWLEYEYQTLLKLLVHEGLRREARRT